MSNEPEAGAAPGAEARPVRGGRGTVFAAVGIATVVAFAGIAWIARVYAPAQAAPAR